MKFRITKKNVQNMYVMFYLYELKGIDHIESIAVPCDSLSSHESAIKALKETAAEYEERGMLVEEFELWSH